MTNKQIRIEELEQKNVDELKVILFDLGSDITQKQKTYELIYGIMQKKLSEMDKSEGLPEE